ncbi:hypothetical protein Trydic_g16404 [Trypoxylus dichotomus]
MGTEVRRDRFDNGQTSDGPGRPKSLRTAENAENVRQSIRKSHDPFTCKRTSALIVPKSSMHSILRKLRPATGEIIPTKQVNGFGPSVRFRSQMKSILTLLPM